MIELIAHDPSFWDLLGTAFACGATLIGAYSLERTMRDVAREAAQRRSDDALMAPPQDWDSLNRSRPKLPNYRP